MKDTIKKETYERTNVEIIGFVEEDVLSASQPGQEEYELPVV